MTAEDAIQLADDRPTSCDEVLYQWAMDAEEVIRELVRAVSRSRPPSTTEPSCEALADFQEGQWWVNELDAVASHPLGAQIYVTADMKRAVAAVHHLLRSARKHEQPSPTPQADSQPAPVETTCWACNDTGLVTTSSSGSGLIDEKCQACSAARAPADSVTAPAGGEIDRLRAALVYVAFALHGKPQYMLAEGIALIDGDTVRVSRDGWTVEVSINPARATPPAQAADSVLEDADPIRALIAEHAAILDQNESAYFELCYHRATGWMAWITDKPLCMPPVVNPDRKVLAQGQGDTADEACHDAARKQGGAT